MQSRFEEVRTTLKSTLLVQVKCVEKNVSTIISNEIERNNQKPIEKTSLETNWEKKEKKKLKNKQPSVFDSQESDTIHIASETVISFEFRYRSRLHHIAFAKR